MSEAEREKSESQEKESLFRIKKDGLWNNTSLLNKGILQLCSSFASSEKKDTWTLCELRNFASKTVGESIRSSSPTTFYPQNVHCDLFSFLKLENEEWEHKMLAAMMHLCHLLDVLEHDSSQRSHRNLHEDYENICTCLAIISGYRMAYLVLHDNEGEQVLSGSHITKEYLNSPLTQAECGKFVKSWGSMIDSEPQEDGENQILALPIDQVDSKQYFLVLRRKKADIPPYSPCNKTDILRNTLFLRGRISGSLRRDSLALSSRNSQLEGIRPHSSRDLVRIFHISDLHAEKAVAKDVSQLLEKWQGNLPQDVCDDGAPIDFLVITGDVAQGRGVASGLEENYEMAAQILRNLAFQLWKQPVWGEGEGEARLSQTWVNRTLITTGNHDYASMNELETMRDPVSRRTSGGRPSIQEGSAMVKFPYYADFLRKLLHQDMGNLVDDGMNEFRVYPQLNLAFLVVNSSYQANALRNNKVQMNDDFFQLAKEKCESENKNRSKPLTTVFLGHHGPLYQIDYVADQYYGNSVGLALASQVKRIINPPVDRENPGFSLDESVINALIQEFGDESSVCHLDDDTVQMWLLKHRVEYMREEVSKSIVSERKRSVLYQNLSYLQQIFQHSDSWHRDEQAHSILNNIWQTSEMSVHDQKHHDKLFSDYKDLVDYALSGHTHKKSDPAEAPYFEVGRFLAEKMTEGSQNEGDEKRARTLFRKKFLHFGILTLSFHDSATTSYQHCQIDESGVASVESPPGKSLSPAP